MNASASHSERILLRYLIAAFLARLAVEGTRIAFVLLSVERTGNATAGGLLVSAFLVPNVIAAPVVGRIADRAANRARVHAIAIAAFATSMVLACLSLDHLPLAVSLVIAVGGGVAGPLLTGGMTSLVSLIVPPEMRQRAYSLDILTYNVAGIAGPGITAVIAGWRGAFEASWLLVAMCVMSAVLASSLGQRTATRVAARPPTGLLNGLEVFWKSRSLASATLANSLSSAANAALSVGIVVFGEAHWSSTWTAIAVMASACGGVVGSITYARWPFGSARPERTNLVSLLALTLPLAALLVTANPLITVAALVVSGYWSGPMNAAVFLVRDRESLDDSRTQVFTLAASLKMTAAAGGAALAGIAANSGPHPVIWFVLACNLLGVALGATMIGGVRPAALNQNAGPATKADPA